MRTLRTIERALLVALLVACVAWCAWGCGQVPIPSDAGEIAYSLIYAQALLDPGSIPPAELEAAGVAITAWRTSSDPAAKAAALIELLRIKAAYCPFREAGCAAHGDTLAGAR